MLSLPPSLPHRIFESGVSVAIHTAPKVGRNSLDRFKKNL